MIKRLKLWIKTLRLKFLMDHSVLTPKGACFLEYLKKKQAGEEVFVEAYQESIRYHMEKQGKSEKEIVDDLVAFFSMMKPCPEHNQ